MFDSLPPDWAGALAPVAEDFPRIEEFLATETGQVLPAPDAILRAFTLPFAEVKVLIVGQDPYPTPGHAVGLAFSAAPQVRPVPRSLVNIFKELQDDVGVPIPDHGDLSVWAEQGVLLLNRVLTVRAGEAASHQGGGWERITECAIRALAARGTPLVSVLWGRAAGTLAPLLEPTPVLLSPHPSPLSARRGFFGSRPFSRVNAHLASQGAAPVDWRIPTLMGRQWKL